MWTEDSLMVLRPEDQEERNGIVELMPASQSVGGWGAVLVNAGRGTSDRTPPRSAGRGASLHSTVGAPRGRLGDLAQAVTVTVVRQGAGQVV